MSFFNFLENLFTGFRPYNFIRRLRARSQGQKNLHPQDKPQKKKFMSKHRYTHTTRKWNIGNMHTNNSKYEIK